MPRLDIAGDTVHVNGMFRHGYLLAPALAVRLADALLEPQRDSIMSSTGTRS